MLLYIVCILFTFPIWGFALMCVLYGIGEIFGPLIDYFENKSTTERNTNENKDSGTGK